MSVIIKAFKSSLEASTKALNAAEEALAAAKLSNIHAQAAHDAFCVSGYVPPFPPSTDSKEETEEDQKRKQSSCLQGNPLTKTLIYDPVCLRVKSNGKSWKDNEKRMIIKALKSSLDASTAYDAFCISGYVPPFPPSTESKEKMKEAECVNCKRKQSSRLPGKPLTETLIQDPVELRVKSNGNSWKENEMGIIGTIVKKKKTSGNCFLKV